MTRELTPSTLDHLRSWVGRTETTTDRVHAVPLNGLVATLDRDDPPMQPGTPVPPLWHWLFFLPQVRQGELGPDGHPARGGFLPPVPLPRRMWAGSRLRWDVANPLRVDDDIVRSSRIASVEHKRGRSGDLVFVQVDHEIRNATGRVLQETHDIVYRAPPAPGEAPVAPTPAATGAAWQREWRPDAVMLFRYSALTFNGHRIHYDRSYVTGVEGYPGLIVHGPLIATLLLDLLRRHLPDAQVKRFSFKAVRPAFDIHPFTVCGKRDGQTVTLWSRDHEGWLTMQASAEMA